MSFQGNINNHKEAGITIEDYIRNKELKLGIDSYSKILVELKEKKEITEEEFFYYKNSASEEEKKKKIDSYYIGKEKTMKKLDIKIGVWQEVQANKTFKNNEAFNKEYMIQTSYEVEEGRPFRPINIPLVESRNLEESLEYLKKLDDQKTWGLRIRILKKIIELNK